MHVDIVRNHWLSGYQELQRRVDPDDPAAKYDGDYVFATEPHREEDCPFKDSDRLYMVPVPVPKGETQ